MTHPAVLLLAAYLIGGIPFGYLLVRLKTGRDVRSMGSGNIGATNVLRTTGRAFGVLTLLLDIAKGWFAVWLMGRFTALDPGWMSAAGAAVVLGHAFPVFLKFKGGKGVAGFVAGEGGKAGKWRGLTHPRRTVTKRFSSCRMPQNLKNPVLIGIRFFKFDGTKPLEPCHR